MRLVDKIITKNKRQGARTDVSQYFKTTQGLMSQNTDCTFFNSSPKFDKTSFKKKQKKLYSSATPTSMVHFMDLILSTLPKQNNPRLQQGSIALTMPGRVSEVTSVGLVSVERGAQERAVPEGRSWRTFCPAAPPTTVPGVLVRLCEDPSGDLGLQTYPEVLQF